jgi:hypothetical protein
MVDETKPKPSQKKVANKKKRKGRDKKKAAALLVGPFLVALAPNIPPAVAQITQTVVEAQQSADQYRPTYQGADGYIFAADWAKIASDPKKRAEAIDRASGVVAQALIAADAARQLKQQNRPLWEQAVGPVGPESPFRPGRPEGALYERALIQWILAGAMTPGEVRQALTSDQKPQSFYDLVERVNQLIPMETFPPGRPVTVVEPQKRPKLEWLSAGKQQPSLQSDPSSQPYAEVEDATPR